MGSEVTAGRFITREDLQGCHRRMRLHMRMAKGGFMRIDECIEHPRLLRKVSAETRRHQAQVTYSVDGIEFADLAGAVGALNRTPEENQAIADEAAAAAREQGELTL